MNVTRGVIAGLLAGIPQVVLAQAAGFAMGRRDQADIGPRFIEHAEQHTARSLSVPMRWALAAVFHFEYAAGWGVAYALIVEAAGWRRVPPWLGGGLLTAVVYTAAFSAVGGATQTGTERPPERRDWRDTVVHCTAAGGFAFSTAYLYHWLRERW